ncbi:SCO family protein [uncultured Eudoraea sp.]|uniref:SCO family protein n=1 Tax=uncultured Eudoraea sp. TaxID=1035614 RepID=UPI002631099E|nr:SCO family protein [uncultured Eudoraea sp.]
MEFFKNPHLRKGIIIFLVLTSLLIFFSYLLKEEQPAVYNPSDLNPALVDQSLQGVKTDHIVGPFSLINQNGDTITEMDYEGKIYVADFFFTRCLTVCPVMTNNMEKLQIEFLNDKDVKLLSLSVTPEMDSVPVLYDYASKNGAVDAKWNITTGKKKHIYELARKSYFAVVDQGDGGLQDFIHTPNFVLVDKKKQIRGIYDGTKDDEIKRLIKDIRILKN